MVLSLPRRTLYILLFSMIPWSIASAGHVGDHLAEVARTGTSFEPVRLFTAMPAAPAMDGLWSKELDQATVLRFDAGAAMDLIRKGATHVALVIPGGEGELVLDLERSDLSRDPLLVRLASSGRPVEVPAAAHYRGVVRGAAGSLAAVSVFGTEVMAIVSDATGEQVLGRFADAPEGLHVFYHSARLRIPNALGCHVEDDGRGYTADELRADEGARTLRCVRYYWEVNYDIFQNKGSVANTINYVTGLFNQSAILFANDGIDVTLSEVFVWDVPSPYIQTSTGALLDQFGVTRTSFNGDMAHLLGFQGNGGIAYLNTLCSSNTALRMAYSDINATYSNVPTYSWSVNVVSHEQGHNLGSRHTHACAWNGNNTAIDGCGPAAGYVEGSCPAGPVPTSAVGGTIMSYCHLTSAGIRFQNGFGPQPTAVMVNRVNAASCLSACGTTCDAPGNLFAASLTTVSATLSWAAIGATSYTLRWRPVGGPTWTEVTGLTTNSYSLTGLTQGTAYEFQVLSVCGATTSAYSPSGTFTTLTPCPDAFEPNNSLGTAATLVLPATTNALIASAADQDYYSFSLTTTSTINLYLSNLVGDYDIRLLTSTGTQLAISENGGTTAESINYANASPGTYIIHVFGFNGAFSNTLCYNLSASAFATQGCDRPEGLNVDNITWNSGVVSWSISPNAVTYDLRWKPTASAEWTVIVGLTSNSLTLNSLNPLTSYDVEVRTVCAAQQGSQGGNTSPYSPTTTFVTLEAPCDVVPRSVLALRVFLDGAFRSATGLMVDSLRAKGLLPLTQPYTAMGYTVSGPTVTTSPVFATTGGNAVVDWVLVELRAPAAPFAVVEARVALLQRDGDVVGVNGTSPLGFCANAGTYRVSVRHRNHLGCMTGAGIALSGTSTFIDLSSDGTSTYGTSARKLNGTLRMLWSGNVIANGSLAYTGPSNDRDPILSAVGGSVPTNTVGGYLAADVNLDGEVRYTGPANDRDPILSNVGGSVPSNILLEQLP